MIVIVDYKVGNLNSIKNMISANGRQSLISDDPKVINNAAKLILPGVGHFDYGMERLQQSGLVDILKHRVLEAKVPILGICLGVQLFTESSEEGNSKGLGWLPGKTVAFDRSRLGNADKVPHMGWKNVSIVKQSRLFEGMYENPRFYFVHSFHLSLINHSDTLVTTTHGYQFTAGLEHENIIGVQFHPEKSHKFGLKIFENFAKNY